MEGRYVNTNKTASGMSTGAVRPLNMRATTILILLPEKSRIRGWLPRMRRRITASYEVKQYHCMTNFNFNIKFFIFPFME